MNWNPFTRLTGRGQGDQGAPQREAARSFSPPSTTDAHASALRAESSVGLADQDVEHHARIAEVDMMGTIAVVTLTTEELCQQRGAVALADLLDGIVVSGARHMVLDIQNVQYMDSACIGCMVEALNRLARSGGRIALANPGASVANLFRITRLDRVFPICADVLSAINLVERGLRPE